MDENFYFVSQSLEGHNPSTPRSADKGAVDVTMYPNPNKGTIINIVGLQRDQSSTVFYSLHSTDGRIVETGSVNDLDQISFKNNLRSGIYFIVIKTGTGILHTDKLVIAR